MKQSAYILVISCFLVGCTSARTKATVEQDQKILNDLIINKSFEIESQWAQPLAINSLIQISNVGLLPPGSNAGSINLVGNANYLQVKDTMVKAFLPFYGERRMGGTYGNIRNGIQFDSEHKKYKVKKGKKGSYQVSFEVNDENNPNESYQVQIQVFSNLSSIITINSSHRSYIQYRGIASNIKLENE